MAIDVNAILQDRAKCFHDARELVDKADSENRALNPEEQERYEKFFNEADEIKKRVDTHEKLERAEAELAYTQENEARAKRETPEDNDADERANPWARFLRGGIAALDAPELRALQADDADQAGNLIMPEKFLTSLIQAVDDRVYFRQWSHKELVTDASSLGVPSLDNDPADPTWTPELSTGDADTTMSTGKRIFQPQPLAQRILVSATLLRKAANVEALVRQRLAYKLAVVEETAFMTGSGAGEPLGVFIASAHGITTGRDVDTDNTSTTIEADNLRNVKYALKSQYWPRARWVMHPNIMLQISKLKDGNQQYLLTPGISSADGDRLVGFLAFTSEFAPSTSTSTDYVMILGDFSMYWIVDALSATIQRLNELYAATNQVGFISRTETDGMPVLEEAFVRSQLG